MAKLATIKTKETTTSVTDFLKGIDDSKRKDAEVIMKMMQKAIGEKPKMWGSSIIGFGKKVYESPTSGRQVEWFKIGLSPRKANITVYLIDLNKHEADLKKLGKHKTGAGCLYMNKLADIDLKVLEKMIASSLK